MARASDCSRRPHVRRGRNYPGPQSRPSAPRATRALTAIFGALAATALFLTMIGLFGMLAGCVREPSREIAVRSALGASKNQLRAPVLKQRLSIAALGIVAGPPWALGWWDVLRRGASNVGPVPGLTLARWSGCCWRSSRWQPMDRWLRRRRSTRGPLSDWSKRQRPHRRP